MKKLIYAVAAILLLVGGYYLYIYWALGNDDEAVPNQPIVGENLEGEADPSRMTLDMATWRWQRVLYNSGVVITPNKAGAFTLEFNKDGTFTATTDCNHAGGKYVANNGSIAFNEIYSTLMYCEGAQEAEFIRLLNDTTGYRFTSRGELILDLKFDSGSVIFR